MTPRQNMRRERKSLSHVNLQAAAQNRGSFQLHQGPTVPRSYMYEHAQGVYRNFF